MLNLNVGESYGSPIHTPFSVWNVCALGSSLVHCPPSQEILDLPLPYGNINNMDKAMSQLYDSTSIPRAFDGHSTAYQRWLSSQWRNPIATVTVTY